MCILPGIHDDIGKPNEISQKDLGISVNNIRQSAGAFRARRAKLLMIFFALLSSIEFDFYAEDCV